MFQVLQQAVDRLAKKGYVSFNIVEAGLAFCAASAGTRLFDAEGMLPRPVAGGILGGGHWIIGGALTMAGIKVQVNWRACSIARAIGAGHPFCLVPRVTMSQRARRQPTSRDQNSHMQSMQLRDVP